MIIISMGGNQNENRHCSNGRGMKMASSPINEAEVSMTPSRSRRRGGGRRRRNCFNNYFNCSRLLLVACCFCAAAGSEQQQLERYPVEGSRTMRQISSAYADEPVQVGGMFYDEPSELWHGINEHGWIAVLRANWEDDDGQQRGQTTRGTVDTVSYVEVDPNVGFKMEGMDLVPSVCSPDYYNNYKDANAFDGVTSQYYLASESHSKVLETNSYFSKRHGQPDLNTYVPSSFKDSRFVRAASDGEIVEEIPLPDWLYWDGVFNWDPTKCYGTRVYKGIHDLSLLNPTTDNGLEKPQLVMVNQIALYQDGPEPTIFEGSHVRIMFWDVEPDIVNGADADARGGGTTNSTTCVPRTTYSRSYRYQTSPLYIDTFQKGARHLKCVFAILALSPTEFIIAETEIFEGFGIARFLSDVFYVRINSPEDTVDHCESLMDCDDVEIPVRRHLLRRDNGMELGDVAFGPEVEIDGVMTPTLAIGFETDDLGILMELYAFNASAMSLEPVWESSVDGKDEFVRQRTTVLAAASVAFVAFFVFQLWWIRRRVRAEEELERSQRMLAVSQRHLTEGRAAQSQRAFALPADDDDVEHDGGGRLRFKYRDYILASAVTTSCLLGGLVFGFPGLVLILRKEGVYADVCSCGVFCAGQQEQLSIVSTMGFAAAIGSRLFAGIFLDKFGPKMTGVLSGLTSLVGLIVLATAKDVSALNERVAASWIVLAVGGSSMHLTSFHVTNLQESPADKRKASLFVSAGFGAGSLVLPVLQLINQYGNVSLQTICSWYSAIAALLTLNCFFVQPWRSWNALGSEPVFDLNCFSAKWWPSHIHELTAIKKANSAKFPPLKKVLNSFSFWGECAWFSTQLFLLTYYLSTINQILFALGDASVDQDPDNFQNNMYTRAAVFFNGLGWLWSPIVGYLMRTRSFYTRVYIEIAMAFVMTMLLTVPVIEVQVVVFLLQALVRLQVFSNHFAYLGERFGFRHFGLLNGISSFAAGAFGLLGYLLQMYSLFIAQGNFTLSYFMVAAMIAVSALFPLILKQKDKKEEMAAAAKVKAEQNGDADDTSLSEKDLEKLRSDDDIPNNISYFHGSVEDLGYSAFIEFLYDPNATGLRRKHGSDLDTSLTHEAFLNFLYDDKPVTESEGRNSVHFCDIPEDEDGGDEDDEGVHTAVASDSNGRVPSSAQTSEGLQNGANPSDDYGEDEMHAEPRRTSITREQTWRI